MPLSIMSLIVTSYRCESLANKSNPKELRPLAVVPCTTGSSIDRLHFLRYCQTRQSSGRFLVDL